MGGGIGDGGTMEEDRASDRGPELPRPAVVYWFKWYAGVLAFIYLLVTLAAIPFLAMDPADLEMAPAEATVFGVILLVVGGLFLVACVLPFFLKPRPWVWVYNLVIICLGLTSACFMAASIPLLIFWLKPEAKAYYGRG
jgi:hypothetical protein